MKSFNFNNSIQMNAINQKNTNQLEQEYIVQFIKLAVTKLKRRQSRLQSRERNIWRLWKNKLMFSVFIPTSAL